MDSPAQPLLNHYGAINLSQLSRQASSLGPEGSLISFPFTPGPSNEPVTAVDLIKLLPFSWFQYLLIITHMILYISSSFLIYNMAFMQMAPQYICFINGDPDPITGEVQRSGVTPCNKEKICSIRRNQELNKDPFQ